MDLQKEILKLQLLVSSLESAVSYQSKIIKNLELEIKDLKKENKDLRERLQTKTSNNSSIPPSKDENRPRKNQTLRRSSGRKPGGQKGHRGDTLKMTKNPDHIIKHIPSYCKRCGKEFHGDALLNKKRQVIDIPPITPIITEHQVYSKICTCGYCTVGAFPENVKAPISYGDNVETLIGYLNVRQYISIGRIQEFFAEVTKIKMSQGTICNKLRTYAKKCLPIYKQIKYRIEQNTCVGSDETGFVVNGQKGWMWTWQTPKLTYIVASTNRGIKTIADTFEKGLPLATLVHDCWRPHFNMSVKTHQLCLAHLRRELNFFIEQRKETWSYEFEKLLRKSLKLNKQIQENPNQNYQIHILQINKSADKLLDIKIDTQHKKLKAFHNRILKYREYLFPFLENIHVPPDNNASERAIRNVKVKQKVSGQFKLMETANYFAVIRSVIDTCIKNKAPVFNTLSNICTLQPE